MIEFKAECGHTVRARDEDAGSVVRCSYCGRNAEVPDKDAGDLDFLFRDIKQPDEPGRRRRKRRTPKPAASRDGRPATFDPFAVVLKLCYVAALLVVGIVIARKWVLPMFEEGAVSERNKLRQVEDTSRDASEPKRHARTEAVAPGLIGQTAKLGLYVASVPEGAAVFCAEESKAPKAGRINEVPGVRQFNANGPGPRVPDGEYVVEVVFPWNDEKLTSETLSDFVNYRAFRRRIDAAPFDEGVKLMRDYFLPDEAADVFVAKTEDQIYLVRQYRGVTVRQGMSEGVRALFLPRIRTSDSESFSIEALLHGYIPAKKQYEFNELHVRSELVYYEVVQRDIRFVIEALSRCGVIPYVTPAGKTRLFKIDIHGGEFKAPVIENRGE